MKLYGELRTKAISTVADAMENEFYSTAWPVLVSLSHSLFLLLE